MKKYIDMSKEELQAVYKALEAEYEDAKKLGLKLDMSRGKPASDQLDICTDMLSVLANETSFVGEDGVDCRNYGVLDGIAEARRLMADMVGVDKDEIIVYGNSSLNIMYDTVARSYHHGVLGSTPWIKLDKVKFICVVPGYDRHFAILDYFGIEPVLVPILKDGPDMDMVEKLVSEDESIKGIWCVPKYSNPTGNSYSDEVVKRFAALKPKAKDFRIYWDNAYALHHLYDNGDEILEILSECKKAGNEDMVYEFMSTSKISFSGAGLAAMATSKANKAEILGQLKFQTIGHDKLNQLMHVRYFKDIAGVKEHMKKHAALIRPKFEIVDEVLNSELSELGIASWTKPNGGYFISFDVLGACAKEIVGKCKEAGVVLTAAGATYPKGKDPEDKNIRIAPSFPTVDELKKAAELLALCTKLVCAKKLLA